MYKSYLFLALQPFVYKIKALSIKNIELFFLYLFSYINVFVSVILSDSDFN